jgi:hypothetical protein
MRAKRGEKKTLESQQNEGAQMISEPEGDGAMAMNLGLLESMVLSGYYETVGRSETRRVAEFDMPAVKIMFHVSQIVRFLLERGLRFRNLGFCGHDLI